MKAVLALVLSLTMVACTSSTPEDKVADVLEKAFNKEAIQKKIEPDVTKLLGTEDTKFKKSVLEFFVENTKISWSDIKIQGDKATAKISGTSANGEEFAGLFFMAAMVDQKKLKDMTLDEFINELAKSSKGGRKTASTKDMKIDNYETTFEFDKKGEEWVINEKSVTHIFDKKNKVKAPKK